MKIAISILSANLLHLKDDLDKIKQAEADYIHIDVMDGHYVPNISFGPQIIKDLSDYPLKQDTHLMIYNPLKYIDDFTCNKTEFLTVHYESDSHIHRVISKIKENGIKAGIALNPASPIHLLNDILSEVDLILLMSVNPGFSNQKFLTLIYDKIRNLDKIRKEKDFKFLIEIDGGINLENALALKEAGSDILVSGSSFFNSKDKYDFINKIKNF